MSQSVYQPQISSLKSAGELHKYVIDAELPRVKKEDLKINIENDELSIEAKMKDETSREDQGKVILRERRFDQFSRGFYLGNDVNETDIGASSKHGLLKPEIIDDQAD